MVRAMIRASLPVSPLLCLCLCACGGGSGGGDSTPTLTPNAAPTLNLPVGLTGGPSRYSFALPTTGSQTLTFTAFDGDGDSLLWQVGGTQVEQTATGLVFTSPVRGTSLTLQVQPVGTPAAATIRVLVEDPRGAAAAIDLQIVRSGAPSVAAVTPDSAFTTAPQQVRVDGAAFSLGNTVTTQVRFAGLLATHTTVSDENTLHCTTPTAAVSGANDVAVSNPYGSAALPATAFTMYAYPVDLVDNDTALDAGAGDQLAAAHDGTRVHVAWIEGGALHHRGSMDAGATFSASQVLSGAETPSQPQIAVVGDEVTVVWVGNGIVQARSSLDGGATFGAVAVLGNTSSLNPQVRLAASGAHRYCAWSAGGLLGQPQHVRMTSSDDSGVTWRAQSVFVSGNNNQLWHALACDGSTAWLLAIDVTAAIPGAYLSRTTDGGATWANGVHVGPWTIDLFEPQVCNDGQRVNLAWNRGGALEYMTSTDGGATWPNQATELRPANLGLVQGLTVACEGDLLAAAYQVGQDTIGFTRVGSSGAFPQHVTLSTVLEPVGAPSLAIGGNYAYVAWRGADVAAGTARIRFASSVDRGVLFTTPTGFGDGTAAQDAPRLLADSARLWLGWRDQRSSSWALFTNRTER